VNRFKTLINSFGLSRALLRERFLKRLVSDWFLTPYLRPDARGLIVRTGDPVRSGALYLAIEEILKQQLAGAFAECGVYRGELSRFIHGLAPAKRFYLFDTFQGFDIRDSHTSGDGRFDDTSVQGVLRTIGETENIIIREGFFPETAQGLEAETFSLVVVDFDKYEPTIAALEFFYPRLSGGGYLFVHDYNSPESDWACSRALNEFLKDKIEKIITIPDAWGTAMFRKL
jgi:O-methyltransferase